MINVAWGYKVRMLRAPMVVLCFCWFVLNGRTCLVALDEAPFILAQWQQELQFLDVTVPAPGQAGKSTAHFHHPQADNALRTLMELQRQWVALQQLPVRPKVRQIRDDVAELFSWQLRSLAAYRGSWQVVHDSFRRHGQFRERDLQLAISNLLPAWHEWRAAWRRGEKQLTHFIYLFRFYSSEPAWLLQRGDAWVTHAPVAQELRTPQPIEFALGRPLGPAGEVVQWRVERQRPMFSTPTEGVSSGRAVDFPSRYSGNLSGDLPGDLSSAPPNAWQVHGFSGAIDWQTTEAPEAPVIVVTGRLLQWDPWLIEAYFWAPVDQSDASAPASGRPIAAERPLAPKHVGTGAMTTHVGFVAGVPFGRVTPTDGEEQLILRTEDGRWRRIPIAQVVYVLHGSARQP